MPGIRVYKNSGQHTNNSFPNSFHGMSYNIKYRDFTSEIIYPYAYRGRVGMFQKFKPLQQPDIMLEPWLNIM